jgi:carboxylesterase type B
MLVKNFLLILFLVETIVIIKSNESENNAISVTIKNVKINGRKEKIDGKDVNVFLGIPYAEPPTGELRFKKPLPVKQSAQIIDATEWPNPCFQIPMLPQNFNNKNFSEDCLYLNIWSPLISDTSDELKPVMFWIHGGALLIGSSVEYYFNGEVLSTKGDVVVVTINYRLGPFGFLYTGTDDAPGNMGLWDQALALEWVNDNIKYFGGDPQKITVFGESAGAWSTNLHIVSPITRNLFNNAIMMSGSAINNMAGDEPQNIMNSWIKGAKVVGCTDEQNSNENSFTPKMIECFKNSAPEKLASIVFLPEMKSGLIGWMPQVVVDGQFLPKKPFSMLKSGDYKKNLNLLIGTTEDEGSFLLPFEVDNIKYNAFSPQNLTFSEAYDELKRITSILPSKIPINGEDVAKLYFTGLSDNNDFDLLRCTIGIAIGDYLLGCPNIQFAKTLFKNDRKNNKVYQYYYNS